MLFTTFFCITTATASIEEDVQQSRRRLLLERTLYDRVRAILPGAAAPAAPRTAASLLSLAEAESPPPPSQQEQRWGDFLKPSVATHFDSDLRQRSIGGGRSDPTPEGIPVCDARAAAAAARCRSELAECMENE
tara:strand:+ start:207 stop:608 length:402 start_codon:yes stop_codon:yes gene_type:complete